MNSETGRQIKSENREVTRAAGVVGMATLLSRIFGYIRDMVLASYFGAGMAADAFIAAFRIPNLLRRLFGEGSLSIAFVPVFTEAMASGDREDGLRLAVSALKLLLVCLSVIAVVGVVAAPTIIHLVAPGFSATPEKMALTITLTRIMFPYVILIGLVALCMGILNVMGHFAAPAIAPVLLNLAMIGSVVAVSRLSDSQTVRVMGLAGGVLLGGVLQLVLQVPFLVKHSVRFWKPSGLWHPTMKKVGILMLPTIFGAAVYQINILVGTLLASLLPEGSVSYLYYADRLVQFPLGIFAQAAATAVLPSLSRQAADGDHNGMGDTFGHAMSLVLFITIPAMVGLVVLREPIVALLFRHGVLRCPDHAIDLRCPFVLCFGTVGLLCGAYCGLNLLRHAGYPDPGKMCDHLHRRQHSFRTGPHGPDEALWAGPGHLAGLHGEPGAAGCRAEEQTGGDPVAAHFLQLLKNTGRIGDHGAGCDDDLPAPYSS
jgi:putative peptidoglycan lipid II flippase